MSLWQISAMPHDAHELETLFGECFFERYRTRLEGGGREPLYVPSPDPALRPHRVVYREDYFASALHEVAHWCLAGSKRRRLEDYGYWYAPDGRSQARQLDFERVEARPQAIEWILSDICGFPFELSADNLEANQGPSPGFERAVRREKQEFLAHGLPPRAAVFRGALAAARDRIIR